jgi:hypothetical protein
VKQGRDEGNSDPCDIEDEMPLVPSVGRSVDNDESVMLVQSFSENNQKRLKGSVNLLLRVLWRLREVKFLGRLNRC